MAKRQSFDESIKGAAKGGGDESKGNTIKVVVLVIALIGAGVLLAWHFGILSTKAPPARLEDTTDPEMKKAIEESQKVNKEVERIRKSPAGS